MFIFTFTFNPETQEAAFAGNIEIQQALQILQQLVIADAVKKAQETLTRQKEQKGAKVKEKKGGKND